VTFTNPVIVEFTRNNSHKYDYYQVTSAQFLFPTKFNLSMGRKKRYRPERLPEKLKQIRESLGISQEGMVIRLRLDLKRNEISNFELGVNEPALDVLLAYARIVNIYLDVLADDNLNLPDKLPSSKTSLGKKRRDN
jgi:DNA-binding XRE family transcriptional regulator